VIWIGNFPKGATSRRTFRLSFIGFCHKLLVDCCVIIDFANRIWHLVVFFVQSTINR
jgi:hypothetical protein